ncbi:alpha/beta hydrolase family protein [Nocardioides nematodiphilus]|uniref:alpha/beta hydrolase family protein n=1 Tax=Nocardioides nematodiphilus TaxID=2849669 RepID=UPI001CD937DF|nr:alpha/beta fold hydrolase [Nocardioides nematodiphilus]MCA1981675.1 alpha/beta fold hydrolase [Nocardioides nematodiphilus]
MTAAPLRHTEIVLEREEGTSFTVTIVRAVDAGPTAPVVLVQPAMGMKARYYPPLLEALAAAGVHAAVSEQRGHEATGGRLPSRAYTFGYADLVADLGLAVDAVRAELPGARVVVLGHSLGGQIASLYAARRPDALAGLIFVGSGTPHWRDFSRKLLVAAYGFPLVARIVGHFPGERLNFAGREARGLMRDWGHLARTGRFAGGDAGLADLEIPVLAISIEDDWLAPISSVDGLVDKLAAATVTRVHVEEPGIDHFKWAKQTDPVVPLITDWLKTVRVAP